MPSARCPRIAPKAASISAGVLALRTCRRRPSARAADSARRTVPAWLGCLGFWSTATRETFGATCLSISSCLPTSPAPIVDSPVTLPPGRARLATRPSATGSPDTAKTIAIVLLARLAAFAAGGDAATITSTFRATSSAASARVARTSSPEPGARGGVLRTTRRGAGSPRARHPAR